MLKNLIILPEAEQDAAEAYIWYEEQEPGLGEEFLRCVDACIQLLRRNPQMYRLVYLYEPAEFEKLYLATEKFWEVEVASLQERLRELKLIPVSQLESD